MWRRLARNNGYITFCFHSWLVALELIDKGASDLCLGLSGEIAQVKRHACTRQHTVVSKYLFVCHGEWNIPHMIVCLFGRKTQRETRKTCAVLASKIYSYTDLCEMFVCVLMFNGLSTAMFV